MTEAEVLAWLRKDSRKRVVLVELDYMYQVGVSEDAIPTRGTLYFSNFAYVDETGSPLVRYQAVLIQVPEYQRSLDRKTLRGRYNASVDKLSINNADGEFDYLMDLAIDGSEMRVYVGDQDWDRSDFVHLYTCLSLRATAPSKKVINIEVRDPGLLLRKSIGGMVTVGSPVGSPTTPGPSANRFRPINFGYVHQVEPIILDSANLIYVHSDTGTNTTAVAVRDNGVDVNFTDNGDGTFTLDASPDGQVTCDVHAYADDGLSSPTDTTHYRISDAFDELIGVRCGLTAAGRYSGAGSIYELDGVNDYHMGITIPEPSSVVDDILEQLTNTSNGFWAFTRLGLFYYDWMRPEALGFFIADGAPISATITKDDIRGDSFSIDHNIPSYVGYQAYGNVNWSDQTQFATSLTPAERDQFTRKGYITEAFFGEDISSPPFMAYRGDDVSWRGGAPELYHLSLSDSQVVRTLIAGPDDTSIINPLDAVNLSVEINLQDWASVRRSQFLPWMEFIDVEVGLDFYGLELGDIVTLDFPRHGLSGGKLMQVCSIRIKPSKAAVSLGLVRRRFADVNVAPHSDFYLLQLNNDLILQDDDERIIL